MSKNWLQVIYGLVSLFGDLIDFEDPLNVEAAKQYGRDKGAFLSQVESYILRYA